MTGLRTMTVEAMEAATQAGGALVSAHCWCLPRC
jgi:hypothetical protein